MKFTLSAVHNEPKGIAMFTAQLETSIAKASGKNLDEVARQIWKALAAGMVSDNTAERLAEAVEGRRKALEAKRAVSQGKRFQGASRAIRSPDKAASLERRRKQAASGALSPDIARHFTTAEQAALSVIAHNAKRSGGGSCDWFMDKIAAIAGVCRTSVRNAIRKAQELGLVTVQERRVRWFRNLSNVVSIVSSDWRKWLNLKGGGCKKMQSTNTIFNYYGKNTGKNRTNPQPGQPFTSFISQSANVNYGGSRQ